jgi:hypothetical protein
MAGFYMLIALSGRCRVQAVSKKKGKKRWSRKEEVDLLCTGSM